MIEINSLCLFFATSPLTISFIVADFVLSLFEYVKAWICVRGNSFTLSIASLQHFSSSFGCPTIKSVPIANPKDAISSNSLLSLLNPIFFLFHNFLKHSLSTLYWFGRRLIIGKGGFGH